MVLLVPRLLHLGTHHAHTLTMRWRAHTKHKQGQGECTELSEPPKRQKPEKQTKTGLDAAGTGHSTVKRMRPSYFESSQLRK